jgi:hypothetical protein
VRAESIINVDRRGGHGLSLGFRRGGVLGVLST